MINQYNESVGAFSLKCTNVEIRRKTLKYVEIGKTSNTFSDPKILRTHIEQLFIPPATTDETNWENNLYKKFNHYRSSKHNSIYYT